MHCSSNTAVASCAIAHNSVSLAVACICAHSLFTHCAQLPVCGGSAGGCVHLHTCIAVQLGT